MEYDANGNIIGFEITEDKEELLIFEKMVEQIWNDYDDDGNGFLDYNEAKSFAREFMLGLDENNIFCENKFKLTFELVDEDKSGTIDKTEMASFIRQLKAMQIEGNFILSIWAFINPGININRVFGKIVILISAAKS